MLDLTLAIAYYEFRAYELGVAMETMKDILPDRLSTSIGNNPAQIGCYFHRKTNMRRFSSLSLMTIMAAPLRVAVGSRKGCFAVLPALFAGAFFLTANLRGEFVYVANSGDGTISGYTVGTDGNLTQITGSPFTTGGTPSTVGVDTAGSFLYASL
jgi:hypothetical protein